MRKPGMPGRGLRTPHPRVLRSPLLYRSAGLDPSDKVGRKQEAGETHKPSGLKVIKIINYLGETTRIPLGQNRRKLRISVALQRKDVLQSFHLAASGKYITRPANDCHHDGGSCRVS